MLKAPSRILSIKFANDYYKMSFAWLEPLLVVICLENHNFDNEYMISFFHFLQR